jgi:uroporphyrin-III C-methyltransferase
VRVGTVALVGAGPGDPGLMTVRGLELLRRAQVVVYDRLVDPRLLDEAPRARRIYAGKASGYHALPQERINALLIMHARCGRRVVRLKGGDPFVFGRGGEELLACAKAGVACEVIPGITSAVAAPMAAGIPVTHRGVARSFAVVTASTAGTAHETDATDLRRIATAVDTLVLLMAAGRLADTCRALIDAGRDAEEPAALVMWATTPEERTVIGTLRDLPALAAAATLGPPATLIVGAVAAIPQQAATFSTELAPATSH